MLKGPDGRDYRVLIKGRYKAFYDAAGRVERLEYDSNGDGRTDQVALYDGAASPKRVEIDGNFDGKTDRWETYDDAGKLLSVSTEPTGGTRTVELDSDGDGRVDRWQQFVGGHLIQEDLDTDKDGKPDRRIHYDAQGHVAKLEPIR